MNDESLRHDGLNKPARLKQRSAGWIPAFEEIEHDEESRVVKDRTNGSDAEDEPPNFSIFQGRGCATSSSSTESLGIGTCEKS